MRILISYILQFARFCLHKADKLFTEDKIIRKGQKYIDRHDIISFDVFETLITRDCKKADHVFKMVETTWNSMPGYQRINDFSRQRIKAGLDCYREGLQPTLRQIYDRISLDLTTKEKLMSLEKQIERSVITPRHLGYCLYNYARKKRKQIIAISDMYFDADFIRSLLLENGYDINEVIVSCDYNADKSSGRLFSYVLKEKHITRNEIVHFGDSIKADFLGSAKAGIQCMRLPDVPQLRYFKDIDGSALYHFISNRIPFLNNRASELGYEISGPMVVGFCQWLHEKIKKGKYERILFCARDMEQTYRIYNRMYPEDASRTQYMYISQKSVIRAYHALSGECITHEESTQLNYIRQYITQLGCSGVIAIVDSGDSGRTQRLLSEIIAGQCTIHGFYMRVSNNFSVNVNDSVSCAYLYGEKSNTKYSISGRFFESLLTAFHGRTNGYQQNSSGIIVPIVGDDNPCQQPLKDYRDGIEKFYEDYSNSIILNNIRAIEVQDVFLRFAFYPEKDDVAVLKSATTGNSSYAPIILQRKKGFYARHPLAFFSDLKNTTWKGGFLCNCFPHLYLLISRLYLSIDLLILEQISKIRR